MDPCLAGVGRKLSTVDTNGVSPDTPPGDSGSDADPASDGRRGYGPPRPPIRNPRVDRPSSLPRSATRPTGPRQQAASTQPRSQARSGMSECPASAYLRNGDRIRPGRLWSLRAAAWASLQPTSPSHGRASHRTGVYRSKDCPCECVVVRRRSACIANLRLRHECDGAFLQTSPCVLYRV